MIHDTGSILHKLQQGSPISLVRIGDGENLTIKSTESLVSMEQCSEFVMRRQMGFYPSIQVIKEIRENLLKAYSGADIIGIPMSKNAKHLAGHWAKITDTLNQYTPDHKRQYCSVDIGYDFINEGMFNKLILPGTTLNYISCRDLGEAFKNSFGVRQANIFQISPEMKFTSGYDGPPHYPDQFNKVQRWMDVVIEQGKLLLVGGGVIGKVYCNWWRDRGGVAFDIGSVFDEWAGFITRGPERGLDKQGSKFKL